MTMSKKKKGDLTKQMEGEEPENGEDEGTEDETEETEKGCAMKKSDNGITGADLQKSLDQLEEMSRGSDTLSRKDELLSKASEGTLEKSEREELFEILGGAPEAAHDEPTDSPADNIVKSMETNEELAGALDVSDYLREQHTELVKSLHAVGEEIAKSDNRRMEFDLVMAKAVHDIGTMVKSMSEAMEGFLEQPARAPKSRGVDGNAGYMEKSFGGQAPTGDTLTKSMVLDALDGLMEKSMGAGQDGKIGNGEDIALAVAKYEQTNMISKPMLSAVQEWRKEHAAH